MKKLFLIVVLLVSFCIVKAENKTIKFTVEPPLVCTNCENKVKENLRFEKGVKSVKPSAKNGEVVIVYDDSKTTPEKLKEGFKKIGYTATSEASNEAKEESCEE